MLYYVYCFKMRRPEEEFFRSSTAKVIRMIERDTETLKPLVDEYEKMQSTTKTVTSMRDFLGG